MSCIEKLRFIDNSYEEDTKFVSIALADLYGDNLDILKQKSLSGRSRTGDKKEAITLDKRKVLQRLFSERISHLPQSEACEREKSLPKLIRNVKDSSNKRK